MVDANMAAFLGLPLSQNAPANHRVNSQECFHFLKEPATTLEDHTPSMTDSSPRVEQTHPRCGIHQLTCRRTDCASGSNVGHSRHPPEGNSWRMTGCWWPTAVVTLTYDERALIITPAARAAVGAPL